jgi:hypothetical protein
MQGSIILFLAMPCIMYHHVVVRKSTSQEHFVQESYSGGSLLSTRISLPVEVGRDLR